MVVCYLINIFNMLKNANTAKKHIVNVQSIILFSYSKPCVMDVKLVSFLLLIHSHSEIAIDSSTFYFKTLLPN